jgi:hypothetical protein
MAQNLRILATYFEKLNVWDAWMSLFILGIIGVDGYIHLNHRDTDLNACSNIFVSGINPTFSTNVD